MTEKKNINEYESLRKIKKALIDWRLKKLLTNDYKIQYDYLLIDKQRKEYLMCRICKKSFYWNQKQSNIQNHLESLECKTCWKQKKMPSTVDTYLEKKHKQQMKLLKLKKKQIELQKKVGKSLRIIKLYEKLFPNRIQNKVQRLTEGQPAANTLFLSKTERQLLQEKQQYFQERIGIGKAVVQIDLEN